MIGISWATGLLKVHDGKRTSRRVQNVFIVYAAIPWTLLDVTTIEGMEIGNDRKPCAASPAPDAGVVLISVGACASRVKDAW